MNWIHDYQLFLFDFDGLLVDTEGLHYASYIELTRRRGLPLSWDFERFCKEAHSKSMGFFDGWEKEYPDLFKEGPSKQELYEEKKRIYEEFLHKGPLVLMEGAEALISALDKHQIKCAVVTNSPKAQIEIIKNALPVLKKIPLWITREQYVDPKPSPEGYLKAISALASPGDRIIGFEDTLKGLQALVAAGVEAMLVCPSSSDHINLAKSLGAKHFEKIPCHSSCLLASLPVSCC